MLFGSASAKGECPANIMNKITLAENKSTVIELYSPNFLSGGQNP